RMDAKTADLDHPALKAAKPRQIVMPGRIAAPDLGPSRKGQHPKTANHRAAGTFANQYMIAAFVVIIGVQRALGRGAIMPAAQETQPTQTLCCADILGAFGEYDLETT